jgi:hypothetical protein
MIFISEETPDPSVFFESLVNTTVGDLMNKSGTLITSALLTFGIAAAAMAADMPKAAAPMAADAPAAAAPAADASKPATKKKTHKKKKAAAAAPATTK